MLHRPRLSSPRLRAALLLAACLLAACGSVPPGPGTPPAETDRDGPPAAPPLDLDKVPDAEPRVDPIRSGGPNRPYQIAGRSYVPQTGDAPVRERGLASWYGRKFHGRRTASGEVYDMYAMTAAHPTLPIPSYARVRNPANGREVIVRINDRGPFHGGRIVDLSYTAALRLGLLRGVGIVELERLTHEQIRSGAWRRGIAPDATAVAAAGAAAAPGAEPVPAAPAAPVAPADVPAAVAPPAAPSPLAAADDAPPAPAAPEVVADAASAPAHTVAARGFWVQLGAFRERAGAEDFRQRVVRELAALAPLLAVFEERSLHRLQAGPYPSRGEAHSAAERIRSALRLVPQIVERR